MESVSHNIPSPEDSSPTTSASESVAAGAKAATKKAAPMPNDILPELMMLRDGFLGGLVQGMRGRKEIGQTPGGEPVMVLYLVGVRECEPCEYWHADDVCPKCKGKEKGK